ncbi:hypothetical protein EST38_g5149 [Candolleomyces aberdarensis]|uniref:Uncharacterized protein n=1 Tax=Candolleomyces aberdarensis TaxID=2316362 RepID=A0A4Q2DKT0_9AGAR|nr:hypothetical protein EST38_g5149 [Candolleomyces aberdarensis]
MDADAPRRLASLSRWSIERIGSIFEAPSDDDSLKAIEATFAPDVKATMNGTKIKLEHIKDQVLNLRRPSKRGLKVIWKSLVEVPSDPSNREGWVGGSYVIEGVTKPSPEYPDGVEFVRSKVVTVKWEV